MTDGNSTCPKGSILLSHPATVKPVPAFCGKWSCPSCGPRKARRLRKRLARTKPSRLITLTLKPDASLTPAQQLALANKAWSILWRRLRRRFGPRAVGYAKIVELTKAGTPHLHIIATVPFIAQRDLSEQWRQLTGSYVVDIRVVSSTKGVAGYLSNYLTKALQVPPGMRKWSAARAYVPPEPPREHEPDEVPPDASYRPVTVELLIESYLAAGYTWLGAWLVAPGVLHSDNGPPHAWVPLTVPG